MSDYRATKLERLVRETPDDLTLRLRAAKTQWAEDSKKLARENIRYTIQHADIESVEYSQARKMAAEYDPFMWTGLCQVFERSITVLDPREGFTHIPVAQTISLFGRNLTQELLDSNSRYIQYLPGRMVVTHRYSAEHNFFNAMFPQPENEEYIVTSVTRGEIVHWLEEPRSLADPLTQSFISHHPSINHLNLELLRLTKRHAYYLYPETDDLGRILKVSRDPAPVIGAHQIVGNDEHENNMFYFEDDVCYAISGILADNHSTSLELAWSGTRKEVMDGIFIPSISRYPERNCVQDYDDLIWGYSLREVGIDIIDQLKHATLNFQSYCDDVNEEMDKI
jgi:hypothetical protein